MKYILLILDEPVQVLEKGEYKEFYGVVLPDIPGEEKDTFRRYLRYVLVVTELCKDGIGKDLYTFYPEGGPINREDPLWVEYNRRVVKGSIRYAFVEDDVRIEESDHYEELYINKKKWSLLKEKKGLVWETDSGCPNQK